VLILAQSISAFILDDLLSLILFNISVTTAGENSSRIKAFLLKGHIPDTTNLLIIFLGVAVFIIALPVTAGKL